MREKELKERLPGRHTPGIAGGGQWKCKICSKIFKNQNYLDQHFDRSHPESGISKGATTCLANLCPIFGCETHHHSHHNHKPGNSATLQSSHPTKTPPSTQALQKARAHASTVAAVTGVLPDDTAHHIHSGQTCLPKEMEKHRSHCNVVFHRCFPPELSPLSYKLHDYFMTEICSLLECRGDGRRPLSFIELQPLKLTSSNQSKLWLALMIFGAVVLLVFYVVMYLYKNDTAFAKDLRRLSSSRQASRLAFWKSQPKADKLF